MARKIKAAAPPEKKLNAMLKPFTDEITKTLDKITEELRIVYTQADEIAGFDTDTQDLQDEIDRKDKQIKDLEGTITEMESTHFHKDDLIAELKAEHDAQELVFFGTEPVLCIPQNFLDNSMVEALAKLSRVHQPAQLLNLFERLADPAFASNLSRFIDSYDLLY